jgi:hypothetical protein
MLKDAWGAECPDGIWCIRMVCTKRRIIPKIMAFVEGVDVFAYTTIAENWPKWHKEVLEAEQTSQGDVGVGTTSRLKTNMMGQTSEVSAKVTEYVPDKKYAKVLTSKGVIIDNQLFFDSIERGTQFTEVYDVKVSGFAKLLSSTIDSKIRKDLKQNLINVKGILEAET